MAVQKSRKTRSKRGMRRSHDFLSLDALSRDKTTGEIHKRHCITPDGYYRGAQIIKPKHIRKMEKSKQQQQNQLSDSPQKQLPN